jgi:hypothetical protein
MRFKKPYFPYIYSSYIHKIQARGEWFGQICRQLDPIDVELDMQITFQIDMFCTIPAAAVAFILLLSLLLPTPIKIYAIGSTDIQTML